MSSNPFAYELSQVKKAVVGGVVAGGSSLALALSDGNFTIPELIITAGAFVAGFVAVFKTTNEGSEN